MTTSSSLYCVIYRRELASTRRMLESLPEDHWDWQPHPESMSLGQLARHIARIPYFAYMGITATEYDAAAPGVAGQTAPSNKAELLQHFDQLTAQVESVLDTLQEESLGEMWTMKRGETVVFSRPRQEILWGVALHHLIHHRGQLSVYLRMVGATVPGVYGPSSDDKKGQR